MQEKEMQTEVQTGMQTDGIMQTGVQTERAMQTGVQTERAMQTGVQTERAMQTGIQTEAAAQTSMQTEIKQLTCIGCPMGCLLTVTTEQPAAEPGAAVKKTVTQVTGNTCPKGKAYAEKEVTNPTRIVTSTVRVDGADRKLISVKTKEDIPKDKIFACMREINSIHAKAPVQIGDVLLESVAGTGVAVVATKAAAAL